MGTQVGIIYGTASSIIRRIVVPDSDSELPGHVGPGESILIVTRAEWDAAGGATLGVAEALFQQKLRRSTA